MAPRVPVELIARLVGILLIGLCVGPVAGAVVQRVATLPWPPWTSRAVLDWIAGTAVLIFEHIGLRGAAVFLLGLWAPLLGLGVGVYFFLGGVWPLRWIVRRELTRG